MFGAPRPHFPTIPVLYPLDCKNSATVIIESGIGRWPSRSEFSNIAWKLHTSPLSLHSSFPLIGLFPEWRPVKRTARAGAQTGEPL